MQVQAVNEYGLAKFEEFISALEAVRVALEASEPIVARMADSAPGRFHGWQVPDKKEVVGAYQQTMKLLDDLRTQAKEREKELIARTWRV